MIAFLFPILCSEPHIFCFLPIDHESPGLRCTSPSLQLLFYGFFTGINQHYVIYREHDHGGCSVVLLTKSFINFAENIEFQIGVPLMKDHSHTTDLSVCVPSNISCPNLAYLSMFPFLLRISIPLIVSQAFLKPMKTFYNFFFFSTFSSICLNVKTSHVVLPGKNLNWFSSPVVFS